MSKFFKKLKRQKSKNTTSQLEQSPPVTNVATQSEPLPLSFHLDSLLNCSRQSSKGSYEGARGTESSSGGQVGSGGHEEVDGTMYHASYSLEEGGGRRLGYWRDKTRENSDSSQEPAFYLPPPLIPSPPFTLSPSPPPSQPHTLTSHDKKLSPLELPIATPSHQPSSTADSSLLSPTYPHVQSIIPMRPNSTVVECGQKTTSTPNTSDQHTRCGVSDGTIAAWNSTLAELGEVLSKKRGEEGVVEGGGHRDNCSVTQWQVPTDKCEKNEEIWQHRVALEGLQQREIRLMAEVAELRTTCERQRKEGVNENLVSPHPELVVADLEESLRQTEEAVQAVQGESNELREGVERMQDELMSLRRSNSLLARHKQQWMEVASQVQVVLEENSKLRSRYQIQQHHISTLQTRQHSGVMALERELSQMEKSKESVEFQLQQLMEGQTLLCHQVFRLVGVAVGGANSSDSMQQMASLLEKYGNERHVEIAEHHARVARLEKEKRRLTVKVSDAKAVTSRLEQEMGLVQSVVQEGEEAVARLRSQLADLQEREETSQQQLAHAIAQVDKAMAERDAYARIARRWQHIQSSHEDSRALEEAHQQLQQQAREHRAQRKHYKTEIHRLRELLASMQDRSAGDTKRRKKERQHVHMSDK